MWCESWVERSLLTEETVLFTGEIQTNEAIVVSRSWKSSELFCVYYCHLTGERVSSVVISLLALTSPFTASLCFVLLFTQDCFVQSLFFLHSLSVSSCDWSSHKLTLLSLLSHVVVILVDREEILYLYVYIVIFSNSFFILESDHLSTATHIHTYSSFSLTTTYALYN